VGDAPVPLPTAEGNTLTVGGESWLTDAVLGQDVSSCAIGIDDLNFIDLAAQVPK
jgi:hypothetical protein